MMTSTTIRVLHVEDDRIQHAFVAHHLSTLSEYAFEIQAVPSEEAAISTFRQGTFELVILDYHLSQGDGLSCLAQIRRFDTMVPVIAVSGVATDEIASKLIEAGADDYLSKQSLDGSTLGRSVRNALTRARAFKSRFASLSEGTHGTTTETPAET
ncbi:MAG: response regulator [Pirellulales bacterium]|nr:response regulator [Pirellulales bacterium]